eukprot:g4355.t1
MMSQDFVRACQETTRGQFCDPKGKEMTQAVPPKFSVSVETSEGRFTVNVERRLSPKGARRFYNLVKTKFLDNQRFYRVVPNWVVQFGVNGSPIASAVYNYRNEIPGAILRPEPVIAHNVRGAVAFSAAPHALNRTAELYINLVDNSRVLDELGYPVFGFVNEREMHVVDALFSGYGELRQICLQNSSAHREQPKVCDGPDEARIYREGNTYLEREFPRLSTITRASIVAREAPKL